MNKNDEVIGNFSESPEFYVYFHKRLDNNSIFYIGKGKGSRAYKKSGRNKHWKHTADKYGYYAEIHLSGLTEKEAFDREQELILEFGLDNLVNLTLGGHTTSGYRHTKETRDLQSKIVRDRMVKDPEYSNKISRRLEQVHFLQKNDPEFVKELVRKQKEGYNSLSEDVKSEYNRKKTEWLKDENKLKNSIEKLKETYRNNPKLGADTSERMTEYWSDESLRAKKALESKKYMEDRVASGYYDVHDFNVLVVNRKYRFNSIASLNKFFGSHMNTTKIKEFEERLGFCFVDGHIVEVYDEMKHPDIVPISKDFLLKPLLDSDFCGNGQLIVMDKNILFCSATKAALFLGKPIGKKANTTAEWIIKLAKGHNSSFGLGHKWRLADKQDVIKYVLKKLQDYSGG